MAKASNPPGPPSEITHRRLNLRGLIILGIVLLVAVAAFFPLKAISDQRTRRSALEQAKASEKAGDVDLALRHMERYVAAWPDDLPGLEFQAKLLAQTAQPGPPMLAAALANDRVLRLNPDGPESQDVRRRLAQLYIRYSDVTRLMKAAQKDRDSETNDLRYRAASTVARQLIAKGNDDAEAHKLLALALEGMVVRNEGDVASTDTKTLDEAIGEYRTAIKLDPADTIAPERLAQLQKNQKKDPAAAEATMAALIKANPRSVGAHMARYRYYGRNRDAANAIAELDAASDLAPKDLEVQVTAANDAIQRLDFPRARRHIDAIPATEANELQIRTLRGSLELSERHPDEAVEEWRKGLLAVGGSSVDLTWRLAYTLIQNKRPKEAAPLINRYQSLAGEGSEPMARYLRALCMLEDNNAKDAIKELNRVADRIPSQFRPDLYLNLGRSYQAMEEDGQALTAYQKAASLVPGSPLPRRAIASLVGEESRIDALNQMQRALTDSPEDLSLIVDLGRLQFARQAALPEDQRRWDGVDELVQRGLKLEPTNVAVLTLQADVLAASGRLPQALDQLQRSVAGPGKKSVPLWLTYAGALDRQNRREEALQALVAASSPDAAGDHAALRTGRALLLARLNQAQAARDILTKDRDSVPKAERPELARALAELCRELGDRAGARDALVDWARLVPDQPEPGMALLTFARTYDDDEAARLGLEALRTRDNDDRPYGLAARAMEYLRVDRPRTAAGEPMAPPDKAELKRLDEADRLVARLKADAPKLPVVAMLQGMILERRGKTTEAIEAYKESIKDGRPSAGLALLLKLLTRENRFDEIKQLKATIEKKAADAGMPSLAGSFNQIDANVALELGDSVRAEKAVAEMVDAQPDNLTARANYARLLSRNGKNREAEETLRQLTALKVTDPAPWLALVAFRVQHPDLGDMKKLLGEVQAGYKGPYPELLIARCQATAGDVAGAAKLYDAAVAKNGNDLTTLRDAAEFDEINRRYPEAELALRRAVKVDPKASWASRALAIRLTAGPDQGKWEEAWSLIKPGAPGAGEAPEDRLIRATVLARSPDAGQRAEAVPAMSSLANDLPASNLVAVEARVRLAQAFLEVNRAVDAGQIIAPVADDLDRPNPTALALSIESLCRSSDVVTARKHLDRLEKIEPSSPRFAASKAWVLQKGGKPDEALAVVEAAYDAAESSPNGELVALAFQDLLVKLGNKEGALKLARRIAARWPRYSYVLARAELPNGKTTEAIKACQVALEAGETAEALRVATIIAVEKRSDQTVLQALVDMASSSSAQNQKNPEVLNFIATLRHLQGRYDEEVAMYRAVMDSSPTSFSFLNNMAWTLSEGLQRYDEALERADEVIRREGLGRDGQASQYLDTRGVILARLGRLDEAIASLEQSVKKAPNATTYFHLARTYRQVKNVNDYHRCRDMAKQLKLDDDTLDPTDKADLSAVMNGN